MSPDCLGRDGVPPAGVCGVTSTYRDNQRFAPLTSLTATKGKSSYGFSRLYRTTTFIPSTEPINPSQALADYCRVAASLGWLPGRARSFHA